MFTFRQPFSGGFAFVGMSAERRCAASGNFRPDLVLTEFFEELAVFRRQISHRMSSASVPVIFFVEVKVGT